MIRCNPAPRILLCAALIALCCVYNFANAQSVTLHNNSVRFHMEPANGRYSFDDVTGNAIVGADPAAGITLAGSPVSFIRNGACMTDTCRFHGTSAAGGHLELTVKLSADTAELTAVPQHPGDEVRFITAGASPSFGLADHAVENKFSTLPKKQYNTDVTGFSDDQYLSGQGLTRLVSNFVLYPRQHFAELLIEPSMKIIHTSQQQIVQGAVHANGPLHLFYFFGEPHQIYAEYLHARNASGYRVFMPKYQAFGVGWEAFGALGWNTNQKTVTESVDRYLSEGFPLRWMVIGSGFWPAKPEMHETTSFGLWDHEKYPDPKMFVKHFRDKGLAVMLGLRICFITTGPFASEGVAKGYFIKKDGQSQVFTGSWPTMPYYLLDAQNSKAVDWYISLVKRWQDFGINGWKEDMYGYGKYGLRDDKIDPTNDRLMQQGQLIIERNGYLSSNGDLHRLNDFNYDQNQDRGPVNALALAYSGFPLVYPDIVGGTFGENHFSTTRSPRMLTYMMRNAQWASLHSSMGMGEPPWSFPPEVGRVMLQAAKLHERIAPYIYSNARRFAQDGYPWTMIPLPVAFPDDPNVYNRENATTRGYEWLIGDALLATPLYGNDYDTATTRDIYLPAGEWMDFDTGKLYSGNQTLHGFNLPPQKTPLFVGGSGITIEDHDGKIVVCVYPVATKGNAMMTLPAGGAAIHVRVQGLAAGATWSGIAVKDSEKHTVAVDHVGHVFVFSPVAGKTYEVTARP
jgi:alpha-glucosidase (family GH31 glycosyl hydrolase)